MKRAKTKTEDEEEASWWRGGLVVERRPEGRRGGLRTKRRLEGKEKA